MTTHSTNLSAHGLSPGDQLSKYQIVELLGQGGVSMVWKGHDPLIDRYVAIKHLTVDAVSPTDQEALREAFRTEATLLKKLGAEHPHLVKILDFIDEPRGLFIVTEYVEGVSLEQMLAANPGPMDQRQALGIVAASAVALDHIHKQGVVHRDLKPANILLPQAGGLKVCDFGLATIMSDADQDAMTLGTVRYMAPECFAAGKIDGKADVYSLGLMAYEMLAGRAKFEDAFKLVLRDTRNQTMRWMKWHTNQRAVAPPLHELNPNIPQTLSELIGRMMEKDPLQRVGSAEDLITAIKRHFAGGAQAMDQSAARNAPGSTHATTTLPTKSKLPLILAVILIVQALIGGGMWLISEKRQSDEQAALRQVVHDQFAKAKKLFDEKQWAESKEAFAGLMEDKQYGGVAEAATMWADANLQHAEQEARPLMERDFGEVLALVDKLQDRDEMTKRQDDIRRLGDKATRAAAAIGVLKKIQGIIDDAEFNTARQSIEEARRTMALTKDELAVLNTLATGIEVREHRAFFAAALEEAQDLLKRGERQAAITRLDVAMQERGEHPSLRELKQKVQTQMRILSTEDAAREAERNGNLSEAIRLYDRVDQMRGTQEFKDKTRLLKSDIAAAAGEAAEKRGDFQAATRAYLEALAFNKNNKIALAGQNRISASITRDSHEVAGDTAIAAGEYEAAIAHWERAQKVELRPETSEKIRRAKDRIEIGRGIALARAGKKAEALRQLQPFERDREAKRWIDMINIQIQFETFRDKGDAAYTAGDYPDAQRWYRKAEDVNGIDDEQKRAITQRKDDAEYAHLMVKARREHDAGNLKEAEGLAVAAQGIRKTDEVEKLLETVRKKRKEKEENPT